jgi:hypothetical protein
MNRFKCAVAILAVGVWLLASTTSQAADIKVSNVKIKGDPKSGHVEVEFDLVFKADAKGDIVFLCVAAGRDQPHQISKKGLGNYSGHVKAKLDTHRTWASLKGTKGNKPIPIVVHACEVYDLKQAMIWIANHAGYSQRVTTLYPK